MRLAEKNSPKLSASRFYEIAANKSINIARANYYPTLNLEAIDSTGFPGSSGLTEVGGLMDHLIVPAELSGLLRNKLFGILVEHVMASKLQNMKQKSQNKRLK